MENFPGGNLPMDLPPADSRIRKALSILGFYTFHILTLTGVYAYQLSLIDKRGHLNDKPRFQSGRLIDIANGCST
jgi:hypothetical protein